MAVIESPYAILY